MPPATHSSVQEILEDMEPSHPSDNMNGKAKAKELETFDGSDPCKLTSFLLLCNLYFHNNSSYADDNAKVTFALTYLHGMALDFFKPCYSPFVDRSEILTVLPEECWNTGWNGG